MAEGGKTLFFNDLLEEIQFAKQGNKLIFEGYVGLGEFETKRSLIHWKSSLGSARSEDTAVPSLSLSISAAIVPLLVVLWLLEEGTNYMHLLLISNIKLVVNNLKFSSTILHCPMLWNDVNDQLFLHGLFVERKFILMLTFLWKSAQSVLL